VRQGEGERRERKGKELKRVRARIGRGKEVRERPER
jgi:hypothetical protein